MSIKANFKRIAFAVVVTLSLGMLGTAPTNAGTIIGELLTVDGSSTSAASTIAQGETATVSVVNTFTPESVLDSLTVYTSCAAPAGASCYDLLDFFWSETTDSTSTAIGGGSIGGSARDGSGTTFVQNTDDSFVIAGTTAGSAVRFTSNLKFRAAATTTAGVYTVTVFTKSSNVTTAGGPAAVTATNKSVTWTVTVTAQNTTFSALNIYMTPSLEQSAYWANSMSATSRDSAIVASNGKNALTGIVTNTAVAYINVNAKNSLGETTTAARTNICATPCEITATVTNGPGLLSLSNGTGAAATKTLNTFRTDNSSATGATNETLVVYSDGTAGVGTITFYNGTTAVGTASVTFTGTPASATSVSLSDTGVAIGTTSVTVSAVIKDSAGNTLTSFPSGSAVYVFASDTKVVSAGANSTNATQMTQFAAGARNASAVACASGAFSGGRYSCTLTIGDTGTASITLRDSWTVAASTWVSDAVTVTGLGNAANSVSVAFNKATYTAGEMAIITITATDRAGRGATAATFSEVTSSMALGNLLVGSTNSAASTPATTATFTDYVPLGFDSGIETRVVFMPATSGTVTFSIKYTPDQAAAGAVLTTASASAVVTNPAEIAANAATAAAEAATDAANEAIDAANAATDAANIAAEAADAATVAAEEARDAADAATAAVEELATQVATLMAALSAQVKTLANTVAKIAKKVKA